MCKSIIYHTYTRYWEACWTIFLCVDGWALINTCTAHQTAVLLATASQHNIWWRYSALRGQNCSVCVHKYIWSSFYSAKPVGAENPRVPSWYNLSQQSSHVSWLFGRLSICNKKGINGSENWYSRGVECVRVRFFICGRWGVAVRWVELTAPSADCLVLLALDLSLSWIPKTCMSVQFLCFSIWLCSFYMQ
jgi:hypothetical protein